MNKSKKSKNQTMTMNLRTTIRWEKMFGIRPLVKKSIRSVGSTLTIIISNRSIADWAARVTRSPQIRSHLTIFANLTLERMFLNSKKRWRTKDIRSQLLSLSTMKSMREDRIDLIKIKKMIVGLSRTLHLRKIMIIHSLIVETALKSHKKILLSLQI